MSGAPSAVSEARAGRAAPLPRAVTRGESPTSAQAVKVDWLNATFPAPELSVEGFIAFLGKLLGRHCSGHEGRGLFGFSTGVKLFAYLAGTMVHIGSLAMGGESQRGRWMFQLTGKGCGLVTDWESLHELLESLGAKVTRVDLACDFLEGEYTVDDAVRMHGEGGFTSAGRPPSTEVAGDWLDRLRGRTLYIGKGTNGKMLRVYEKGIQLGDFNSPWVRYEVQLGARDREIPLDVLLKPTQYFAGCYPCLAGLVAEAAAKIPTRQTEARTTLSHLLTHLKRSYGKLLHVLGKSEDFDSTELVEEVRVIGVPRRLNPSGVVAGVAWADVQALFSRRNQQ